MDYIRIFSELLQSSTDNLLWAMEQMPQDKLYDIPPRRPDGWSAVRHLFHLYYLDEYVTLPNMRLWLLDKNQLMKLDSVDADRIKRYKNFEALQQFSHRSILHLEEEDIALAKRY